MPDIPPLGWTKRLPLHLLTLTAAFFLTFYGQVVCPFINTLSLARLFTTLILISLIQILFREWLFHRFPCTSQEISPPRHGFHLSVASWLFAGLFASALHAWLYPGFHWSSHLKLLSGYWALGAGILSQLEYVILEHHDRHRVPSLAGAKRKEQITRRIMEGYALFTAVPAIMMIIVSFRFVYEGFLAKEAAWEILFLGLCYVIAALIVSWRYGRALQRDCHHLSQAVQEIARGRFILSVDDSRHDELGLVAHGINDMARGLVLREQIRDAFGRFVNPQVAESFIKRFSENNLPVEMVGERRTVVILMADIRGFTPLSESMEPEVLTRHLNRYFGEMVTAIQNHDGMVDKFIGDAIMAVFGLSVEGDDQSAALNAVSAAEEMRQRLQTLNDALEEGETPLENGIGLHRGDVVAGYIGSPDRLEYTVIGHAVNVAARIEGQTKPPHPPILFSGAVAQEIKGRRSIRSVMTADLKGVSEKMELFTLSET